MGDFEYSIGDKSKSSALVRWSTGSVAELVDAKILHFFYNTKDSKIFKENCDMV